MKNQKQMHDSFAQALELIGKADSVFLTTHEGTDGDDLGSLLAFYHSFPHKKLILAVKGGVPDNLSFLAGSQYVNEVYPKEQFDLLITFGCNNIKRTGFEQLTDYQGLVINFDHHPDNSNFGTVNVVDPEISSVCELMYFFLQHADLELNKEAATALLTGIFTDTGGFKHANTTAQTFETASKLLKKGARIEKIAINTMGRKRPAALKAWAKGLENARFDHDKKLIFSVLTEEDLREAGANDEDLEGFVELLNNIPQAKFALLLRQDGETVKGSLRSEPHKGVDVSKIAKSFGGGGHKLASGFKIKGRLSRQGEAWKIDF